jgi:pyruvate dehydrogenase E2 component (dihydrolipoamide acetyltransferase)
LSTDVIMPALGLAQETGRLVRWLKRHGDQVLKGEPLMEVETDKATVEVESPATGTLSGITAAEGDEIAVGHAIAVILAAGESSPTRSPGRSARSAGSGEASAQPPRAPQPPPRQVPPLVATTGRLSASPKARRLAEERGVDLAGVVGTGPGGAIVEEDVLQAGDRTAPTESPLWRAMSANVSLSWKQAPHFFVFREIDASALVEKRRSSPQQVTYTDLLLRSVAAALTKHPRLNSDAKEVNIGLAVAVPDGLIVPVIHGVDGLSIEEIATQRHEVVERVRNGRLRSADVTGGTFTVSNLGMYGVDLFTAILTGGQAGILAVGRIADRVIAHEGAAVVRATMLMSLSCDHRQVDGVRAAEFMQTLVELIEKPADAA